MLHKWHTSGTHCLVPMLVTMHTFLTQQICFVCIVQHLELFDNHLDRTSMILLAVALEYGAMDKCKYIDLSFNKATKSGRKFICSIAKARGINVEF